jgi:hypothetical protein
MGLSDERQFQTYHRVLNRAAWSSWALSHTLLRLLVKTFVPTGPIICGLDDTIERRRGAKTPALASGASVKAKGIYRDPVRSSHGLCWLLASSGGTRAQHALGAGDRARSPRHRSDGDRSTPARP